MKTKTWISGEKIVAKWPNEVECWPQQTRENRQCFYFLLTRPVPMWRPAQRRARSTSSESSPRTRSGSRSPCRPPDHSSPRTNTVSHVSMSSIKDVSSVSSVAWIKYVQSLLCYRKESIDVAQLPCWVGGKDKQNAKVKCIKATQINFENNLNVELS